MKPRAGFAQALRLPASSPIEEPDFPPRNIEASRLRVVPWMWFCYTAFGSPQPDISFGPTHRKQDLNSERSGEQGFFEAGLRPLTERESGFRARPRKGNARLPGLK